MARQSSIITVRGKIGNVVGMKNGFGTPTGPFIREYVNEIKNPQSDFQMDQRAKMLPAVLFRRQLESVISRAWEGKKYGGPSTREFMKYALKEPWENIPQLAKDSTNPIPGAYLVSRGSLEPMEYEIYSNSFVFKLSVTGSSPQGDPTIADISERIEAKYSSASDGDQITFIFINLVNGFAVYSLLSFFLDKTNETTFYEYTNNKYRPGYNSEREGLIFIGDDTRPPIGFAVVLSREKNNTFQRSTQRIFLDKNPISAYFGNALSEDIADTYRSRRAFARSDWEYQEREDDGVAYISVVLSSSPDGATLTGAGRYIVGDQVVVEAPATFNGLSFAGWYNGDARVSTSRTYTFAASESVDLVATYEDRP